MALICPTIQMSGYGVPLGLTLHHWGMVAVSGSSIGLKAALQGGKVLAQLAYDTFTNQEIVKEAWEEFHKEIIEEYKCKM